MLRDNAIGVVGVRELRVEAVDRQVFDDLLETWVDGALHGWQIKSQTTTLPRDQLREIVAALRDQPDLAAGHLAFESHLSIQGIGELRQLRRLCQNLQARGADVTAVCASATQGELSWLAFLEEIAGDRRRALDLACRIHVDVLGDYQQLRGRTLGALSAVYAPPLDVVADLLEGFFQRVSGTITITAELLEHELRHCERIRPTAAGRASRRREILEQSLQPDLELDPIVDVVGYDLAPGLPAAVQMPYRLRGPTGSRLSLADWASDPSTDRILIRGTVGAGKSSLLRAYHRDRCREALADPTRPIPLLLRVRDLVARDPLEVAASTLRIDVEGYERLRDDPHTEWLLLLDGADEHPSGWHVIESVAARFGDRCRAVVVSSRPVGIPQLPRFRIVDLEPWSEEDVEAFLTRWSSIDDTPVRMLRSSPRFASFGRRSSAIRCWPPCAWSWWLAKRACRRTGRACTSARPRSCSRNGGSNEMRRRCRGSP
jgi:hypothetical protein